MQKLPLNRNAPERPVPKTKAVALSYEPTDMSSAPKVTASGKGFLAERILELAFENDVPVRTDPDLVEIVSATEVGEEVPVEAFIAVAEILRYVYERNGTVPESVRTLMETEMEQEAEYGPSTS